MMFFSFFCFLSRFPLDRLCHFVAKIPP